MTVRHFLYLAAAAMSLLPALFTGTCWGAEQRSNATTELVASILRAYGGAEMVGKVRSVTATGRITEFLSGATGYYARYFARPGKLRIEVMPQQGGEIRLLNGDRGWQMGSAGFTPVAPLELQAMIYQYNYLDLPMGLVAKDYAVKAEGQQVIEGRETYLLLIEPKNALTISILIDAKTHLIVKVSAKFGMGMMGAGELATEYYDFRPVAGVLFPHRLLNFAGKLKLSEIVLDEIAVNRQLPADLFAPP